MMFFFYEMTFLKYKYQQTTLYFIKIIVNLKIFEVRVSVHLNLRVYRRSPQSVEPFVFYFITLCMFKGFTYLSVKINLNLDFLLLQQDAVRAHDRMI